MQNLDVISINIWQILISLCNLVILFLILKRFLYKPVTRVLEQRRAALDAQYDEADKAKQEADAAKTAWEDKLSGAQAEADALLQTAAADADRRRGEIVRAAQEKADGIVRDARTDAELEYRRAQAALKQEIAAASVEWTETLLQRESTEEEQRALIASVLDEMGDAHDGDR